MIQVTVWNEFRHEKTDKAVQEMYPEGIHGQLAKFLSEDQFKVKTATLDEPEHGLTEEALEETDVLIWWGHMAHDEVQDEIVERVHKRVLEGMGLVVLHSGHFSKIFKKLMGTSCDLKWREDGKPCRIWNVNPSHPIVEGIGDFIELEQEEMYGEHFDIPAPDELIFVSWFPGGEVFRSGSTYRRGNGKIFYFQPGHETYPSYYNEKVQKVIKNGIRWCAPTQNLYPAYGHYEAREK
ncbi:trehalose utilization protein ThuA [Paenibacillus oralis]|uniref:Trehalose utilization protein ThuA n=1 Tax=Paenibacillus oralis TaxID=2490856 RepID=A0A3P3U8I6_9BACL|nr:ThuA domain-containing protein [Paenibacillus oralis]RRJ66016.1 trehalose utilization protein ThuA [Paenibacillus oralis]